MGKITRDTTKEISLKHENYNQACQNNSQERLDIF